MNPAASVRSRFWMSAWVQWVTGDRRCSPCTRPPGWWFLCGHDSTDSSVWSASGPTGRSSSCPPHHSCAGSAVLSTSAERRFSPEEWWTGSGFLWPVRYFSPRWAAKRQGTASVKVASASRLASGFRLKPRWSKLNLFTFQAGILSKNNILLSAYLVGLFSIV